MDWKTLLYNKWLWGGFVALVLLGGAVFGIWRYRASQTMVAVENDSSLSVTLAEANQMTDAPPAMVSEEGNTSDEPETPNEAEVKETATPAQPAETSTKSTVGDTPKNFSIRSHLVSFGYEKASSRTIDMVVLHSSYNSTGGDVYDIDKVFGIWKSYAVSPHYAIDRDGTVYRLVEDKNVAYHAGVSEYKGRDNLNQYSIGVEILNTKDDEYTKAQYQAVNDLIAYLKSKYDIKYVVGHDDIAPGRKTDPWNFDWKRL